MMNKSLLDIPLDDFNAENTNVSGTAVYSVDKKAEKQVTNLANDDIDENAQKGSLNANQRAFQRALVREMKDRNTEKIPCFGGVLLKLMNADNIPILSFVVENITDDELNDMVKAYDKIYRSGLSRLISRAVPFVVRADQYAAFNFEWIEGLESLRQYCQSHQPSVEAVMRRLVNILIEYNKRKPNESLHCFSLDTLFVDESKNFWILPLRAFRNRFPKGIAPEAHDPTQKFDETSDLCSAAYVALEAACGGSINENFCIPNMKIKDCLLLIPQCRPSLNTMRNVLGGDKDAVDSSQITNDPPRKVVDRKFLKFDFATICEGMGKALGGMFAKEPADHTEGTCKLGIFRNTSSVQPIKESNEDGL